MRIVIIGSDPAAATGLKQSLAEFGLAWSVDTIAAPGVAGVFPDVDVLVSGLAPDAGWRRDLATLRQRYPEAVRVLLLEQGQEAGGMDLLEGAHRVLRKPLDANELIDAVEGISELRELLDNKQIKQYVGSVDSLPAAPRMYFQLARLMRDPDVALTRIADELSQDPALAARVLRLCNSAYFSAGREIIDIRSAVTRLGLQTVHQVVLATEAFGSAGGLSAVEREAMQERALRTSRLAARLLAGPSAELAATAGLLAEIGRLLPPPEEGAAAPEYPAAGAYLLGLWGLPMPIVEAVAFHREPRRLRAAGFWVAGAVHVAAALVSDESVDEAYLQSVGVRDRLPQWKAMLEQDAPRSVA
ncbi:HDOD domain-containing protein [Luteimonas sp. A277]